MLWQIVSILDIILFIMVLITVVYLSVFAIASLFYSKFEAPATRKTARILILIPCYRADDIYQLTLDAIAAQDYDPRAIDIMVVSAGNKPITNMKLAQYNLTMCIMPEDEYTDVRAWQFGMDHCAPLRLYDIVLIIEAGETMQPTYLTDINEAFQLGSKAIQTHRTYPHRTTPKEMLTATFEEINSSIFRMGHVALGLSSGLLGSGMAFEHKWFRDNIGLLTADSDLKAFEAMVLAAGRYVDYLDDTHFVGKPQKAVGGLPVIDRSKWMYAQWHALRTHVKDLPRAILQGNPDLFDKVFQWILMPRVVMMSIIALMCVITPLFWWSMTLKWLVMGFWVMLVFAIATPDYLINREWEKAFIYAPLLMVKALFDALPSGWALAFTRSHKDEWIDDLRQGSEMLMEQGEKLKEQGAKLKEQGAKLKEQGAKLKAQGGKLGERSGFFSRLSRIAGGRRRDNTTDSREEEAHPWPT
ncbi:MAG: glycosyltransferase [Bacteroidaceae bacterium]|nr:glycosyltransferase [Bacteroidaceae bacterium]